MAFSAYGRWRGTPAGKAHSRINAVRMSAELKKLEAKNKASQESYDLQRSIADGSYLAACQEQSAKNRENFDAMMATINKKTSS